MGSVAEKLLKEVRSVTLGDRHLTGFVAFYLGVRLDGQTVPIGHQPFDKVIEFFIIYGRKLGGIRRIKVSEISLHLWKYLVDIPAIGFVLFAVIEYQGVDPLDIRFQAFFEFIRRVLKLHFLRVNSGTQEVAKPCAAHAGFAKSKQRNVLFVSRQVVAIGPKRVDECVDTFGEEDAFEIVLNKGLGFGIVRQQLFDLSLGQSC